MKRNPRITVLGLLGVFLLIGLGVTWYKRNAGWHSTTAIIKGSPFDLAISELYPNSREAIRTWVLAAVPIGTPRNEVKNILALSFSVDLSGGRETVIDVGSLLPGGHQATWIQLVFDANDRLLDVHVRQEWGYL
jgi:hypothetical protein